MGQLIDWLHRVAELSDMWEMIGMLSLVCFLIVFTLWAMGMKLSDD